MSLCLKFDRMLIKITSTIFLRVENLYKGDVVADLIENESKVQN